METETMEDYAFPSNIMELDYQTHIVDSDMVSPESLERQYEYDQVMMALENDERPHAEQLEIEMKDDYELATGRPSISAAFDQPSNLSFAPLAENAQSDIPVIQPADPVDLDSPLAAEVLQSPPLLNFQDVPVHDPSSAPSILPTEPSISAAESPTDLSQSLDRSATNDEPEAGLPNSVAGDPSPDLDLCPEAAVEPSDKLADEAAALPGAPRVSSRDQSQAPATPSAGAGKQHGSDTFQDTQDLENEDNPGIQEPENEDNLSPAACNAVGSEEFLDGDTTLQWDGDLGEQLLEDLPWVDYESESRPKPRTDLLEHVRVEPGSVSVLEDAESDARQVPGVRLICEACEYSLFRRMAPRCSQEPEGQQADMPADDQTVLLSEPEYSDLYYGPLEALIQSLHNIFPATDGNDQNEFVLNFPALEIKVPEDNVYARELSLFDVDRLHVGARLPDRLLVCLEKQARLVHRFNVLATYVSGLATTGCENEEEQFDDPTTPFVEGEAELEDGEVCEDTEHPSYATGDPQPDEEPCLAVEDDTQDQVAHRTGDLESSLAHSGPSIDLGASDVSSLIKTSAPLEPDGSPTVDPAEAEQIDGADPQTKAKVQNDELNSSGSAQLAPLAAERLTDSLLGTSSHEAEAQGIRTDELSEDPVPEPVASPTPTAEPPECNESCDAAALVGVDQEGTAEIGKDEEEAASDSTVKGLDQFSENLAEESTDDESSGALESSLTFDSHLGLLPLRHQQTFCLIANEPGLSENNAAEDFVVVKNCPDGHSTNIEKGLFAPDSTLPHISAKRNHDEAEQTIGDEWPTLPAPSNSDSSETKKLRVL